MQCDLCNSMPFRLTLFFVLFCFFLSYILSFPYQSLVGICEHLPELAVTSFYPSFQFFVAFS